MIFLIIVFMLLVFLLLGIMALRYLKPKNTIKYDKRDKKLYWATAVLCTILTCIFISLFRVLTMDKMYEELWIYIMFGGFFAFPVIALFSWTKFFCINLYFRRLKKHGYEIPENKKYFSRSLENLNKTELGSACKDGFSRESIVLSVVSFVIYLGVIINGFVFYEQYKAGELADSGIYGFIPLVLFWQIMTGVFWKQRLRNKYRDDVELDDNRKKRKQIEDGVGEIIVCLFCTFIWIVMLYNGSDWYV